MPRSEKPGRNAQDAGLGRRAEAAYYRSPAPRSTRLRPTIVKPDLPARRKEKSEALATVEEFLTRARDGFVESLADVLMDDRKARTEDLSTIATRLSTSIEEGVAGRKQELESALRHQREMVQAILRRQAADREMLVQLVREGQAYRKAKAEESAEEHRENRRAEERSRFAQRILLWCLVPVVFAVAWASVTIALAVPTY